MAVVLSVLGCTRDTEKTNGTASEAVAYLSPDSIYFWIPIEPNDSTWTWNTGYAGAWDHEWTIDVRVPGKATMHYAFVCVSGGGPDMHGTFKQMVNNLCAYHWGTDEETGQRTGKPWAIGSLTARDNGVFLTPWKGATGFIYGAFGPGIKYTQQVSLHYRGSGREPASGSVRIEYRTDDAQLDARKIKGSLSTDEYVIYDVVFTRFQRGSHRLPVQSLYVGNKPFRKERFSNIANLDAAQETKAAFLATGADSVDLSALKQIGYSIVVKANPQPQYQMFVRNRVEAPPSITVSKIAFGRGGSEAMVYVEVVCGGLCGRGEVFHLAKVDKYWVVKERSLIWIS